MMLVLSILVGELGVDRFLLGDTGLGVLKLITAGGLGIWWLIDIFTVDRRTKEYNFKQFNEALQNARLTLPVAR
ncbi:MAG: TM2 domain-containing protein [Lachnospiraceae bacterium]|nr:TM2 domain-containing protein [Lachnospiraceae bacterium]